MRASVIVGFCVIALVGLTLRNNHANSHRVHGRQQAEAKPAKGKGQKAPAAPQVPDSPNAPGKAAPGDNPPQLAPQNAEGKMGAVEAPPQQNPKSSTQEKVLWAKEVHSPPRPSSQAARQNSLELAAQALGEHLQERYPGFKWTPTPKFLIDQDMIAKESEEQQTLADAEAPVMTLNTMRIELHEKQLKAALQEDGKARVQTRLLQAGRGLGGLLIILLTVIGYFRLDDWTKGYISLPLKLTAAAVAIGGSAAVWWLV